MEIVILWMLCGVFSAIIASSKNRSGFGWFLIGLFFGPFGFTVAALPALTSNRENKQELPNSSGF